MNRVHPSSVLEHILPVTVNHSHRSCFEIILKLHQLRADLVIEDVLVLIIFCLLNPSLKVILSIAYNLWTTLSAILSFLQTTSILY